MERMKIEIEKSEYDRLKSREEKLMAYYEWFVDKENDLATVEDIVNENIKLKEKLSEITMVADDEKQSIEHILELEEENKRLQSSLDYANRDIEDMHNKIIELGNKRESQRNMNYKLRKENKKLREELSAYDREFRDEDKKAKNIYKSQKENILMGKI